MEKYYDVPDEEESPEEDYHIQKTSPTMFQGVEAENLIRWQLNIAEELQRIEHLLRKHVPKIDDDGNLYYVEPKEQDQLLNETGINEIMNILNWYLNKGIFLSNFKEDDIRLRCAQFHQQLTDFIFNNYERFGLDTKQKIKHYPMIVMNVTNTVEAAYNRALNGGERNSLRTARQVMQQEPIMGGAGMPTMKQDRDKSLFKPWTWGN